MKLSGSLALLSPEERTVLEKTPSTVSNHEGRLVFFSSPFQELVNWDCAEQLGKRPPHPWWMFEHAARRKEILEFISSGDWKELGLQTLGGELLRSNRTAINVTVYLRTVSDLTGRPAYVMQYLPRDEFQATLQREGMLAKPGKLRSKVYQVAPVGLCYLDRTFRYIEINEHLARINGLTVGQHLGRTVYEVVPDAAQGIVDLLGLAALAGLRRT